MWGLVLSVATIASSLVTGSKSGVGVGGKKGISTSDSSRNQHQLLAAFGNISVNNRQFLSGVALGLGLSLFYSTVLKEFRLVERLRLIWNDWWDWGSKMKAPLRLPVTLLQQGPDNEKNLDQYLQLNDDGYVRLLACPRNIATSTMQVSILSLSVGREIPPRRSRGVEFYYVLSGSGLFSQQGVADTVQIKAGQAFIVDPHCYRWISNRVGVTKLVLLRATDNASNQQYSTRNGSLSVIRMDPNQATLASLADGLTKGMKQVNTMAKDYFSPREDEKKEDYGCKSS